MTLDRYRKAGNKLLTVRETAVLEHNLTPEVSQFVFDVARAALEQAFQWYKALLNESVSVLPKQASAFAPRQAATMCSQNKSSVLFTARHPICLDTH